MVGPSVNRCRAGSVDFWMFSAWSDSMKRVLNVMVRLGSRTIVLAALALVLGAVGSAFAQGVTTGALNGLVTSEQQQPIQGANVIAIHLPSGTSYETATRA